MVARACFGAVDGGYTVINSTYRRGRGRGEVIETAGH
jgi:hypothetical protein